MSKTKKVTISLTPEKQEETRSLPKDLFSKDKISHNASILGYWREKNGQKIYTFNQGCLINSILYTTKTH
jgi:hypothetical protein